MGNRVEKLREYVLSRQHTLAGIYRAHGGEALATYVRNWKKPNGPADDRAVRAIRSSAASIYGTEVGERLAGQLAEVPRVSTIDHHALLCHPIYLNANLIFAESGPAILPVLPVASVSLNNVTSWSACLLGHASDGTLLKFSLLSERDKRTCAFTAVPFSRDSTLRARARMAQSNLPETTKRAAEHFMDACLEPDVLKLPMFWQQAAVVSRRLWQQTFPSAPELAYVPVELVVSSLLKDELSRGSLLAKLLTTETGWQMLERFFGGLHGAWDREGRGTFLFWAVSKTRRRVGLCREGRFAVAADVRLELTPEGIGAALERGNIFSGTLLNFLALSCVSGLSCVGGFNQVNWLTEVRSRFLQLLADPAVEGLGVPASEIETVQRRAANAVTDSFAEANLVFQNVNGHTVIPTLLDASAAGGEAVYHRSRDLAERLTLAQSIDTQLPEIYRAITLAAERKADFVGVNTQEILESNGAATLVGS